MQIINNLQKEIKYLSAVDFYDIFASVVLISGIIYSPFLFTMGLIFMVLRIFFIGNPRQKLLTLKQNYTTLICLLSIYILNIVGLLWTKNLSYGLFELNHKLPFLILPLFALVISPVKRQKVNIIFAVYTTMITIGILIGIIHYLINPYADSRVLIPTARNISFAFHICLSLSVMVIMAFPFPQRSNINDSAIQHNKELRKYFIPLIILFCAYLLIASLVSGIVTLIILMFFAFIHILKVKNKKYSATAIIITLLIVSGSGYWLYRQYDNYFTPKEEFAFDPNEKTALGNSYSQPTIPSIENGYYITKYRCLKEVEQSWLQRTGLSLYEYVKGFEGNENYKYNNVVSRYLNSKGLRKDAHGVEQLTEKDIQNIKKGYSNYIYAKHFSLKPRLYQTFYEFERYFRTQEVEEMSVIQRIFWSKNAFNIIKQHLFIGCGTGDTRDSLVAPVIDEHPELCTTGCNPHNQFIYIMAAFGLLGLCAMLFYILYLPTKFHLFENKFFVVFFIIMICWSFAESSFESYEGMTFISALMSFFCLNRKQ